MIVTAEDAYMYVLDGLKKEGAGTLYPSDFNHDWNRAALAYVKERIGKDQPLLIPPPLTITNSGQPTNGQEVFLLPFTATPAPGQSHGYLHLLNVCQTIKRQGSDESDECLVPCATSRLLTRDQRLAIKNNPFWKPTLTEPYHYQTGHQLRTIVPVGYYTESITIEYVETPIKVVFVSPGSPQNVDPQFTPAINQEIADIAIRSRLEIIESRRFQTAAAKEQIEQSKL